LEILSTITPEIKQQWGKDEYSLSQSDLPEIGSQGVVSEIINGKRELNIRQIRALAKRFNVTPGVFL
jgi:HTH-type transcriptional regulator / antitoxin HigA